MDYHSMLHLLEIGSILFLFSMLRKDAEPVESAVTKRDMPIFRFLVALFEWLASL